MTQSEIDTVLTAARAGKLKKPHPPLMLPYGPQEGSPLVGDPNSYLLGTVQRMASFREKWGDGFEETPSYKTLTAIRDCMVLHFLPFVVTDTVPGAERVGQGC